VPLTGLNNTPDGNGAAEIGTVEVGDFLRKCVVRECIPFKIENASYI